MMCHVEAIDIMIRKKNKYFEDMAGSKLLKFGNYLRNKKKT